MKKIISGGIYLVVDPAMPEGELLEKLSEALKDNKIAAVQVWDNFSTSATSAYYKNLIQKICHLSHKRKVPVLINNRWELIKKTDADGLHLDAIPKNIEEIKAEVGKDIIIGITCNNDLSVIEWANANQLDYISFCSIFTSLTSNSCELVDFETIRKARKVTSMSIFLAGGINSNNMSELKGLEFDGIAVVSGIMGSENPNRTTKEFEAALKQLKNEKSNH